jgi:hypothetical protein
VKPTHPPDQSDPPKVEADEDEEVLKELKELANA